MLPQGQACLISSRSRAREAKSQNLGGRNVESQGLRCIAAILLSGCLPGFGSGEVPLQLLSPVKPPQQTKLSFTGPERCEGFASRA